MKCRWNYFLPLALVFAVTPAMAMELGPIRVESTLDSPLLAEIPIVEDYPGEANGVKAALASDADFAQAGIRRADLRTPLKFSVVGRKGHRAIRVTSTQPVRAPFLDMLIKVTWPKGKLLREYTVLLDPSGSQWQAAAATSGAAAGTGQSVPAPAPVQQQVGASSSGPQHAASGASSVDVNKGDTLFGIALDHTIQDVGQNQMLLALKAANPDAFFENNINALKAGAVLHIPTRQEALKVGKRAATAAVLRQNQAWQNLQKPAIAASAGTSHEKPAANAAEASSGDHLSLVPPTKSEGAAAAGVATSSADASVKELRQALARSKESLSSQTQTASDLQSRVHALEGLQKKTQQLLSLKNAEIATLRDELAKVRKQTGLPAPAASVAAASVAGVGTLATIDAAGSAGASADAKSAAGESAAADTAEAGTGGTAPASVAATTAGQDAGASASDKVAAVSAASGALANASSSAKASAMAVAQKASPQAGEATPQPAQNAAAEAAQGEQKQAPTEAVASQAPTTQAAKIEPATTKAASKPAVAVAAAAEHPAASPASTDKHATDTVATASNHDVATPWYEELWARLVLGLVVVLLIVAWAVSRRRPRDVLVGPGAADEPVAPTLADEDTLPVVDAEQADTAVTTDDGEGELLRQLAANPEDAGLHLELASLYYVRGDVDRFEAVSESMHAYLDDDTQPEWQEVLKMGRELAPDHPLFVDTPSTVDTAADEMVVDDAEGDDLDRDDVPGTLETTERAGLEPMSAAAEEDDAPAWHFMTETTPRDKTDHQDDDLPPLDMDSDHGRDFTSDDAEPTVTSPADAAPSFNFDADSAEDLLAAVDPDDVGTASMNPDDVGIVDMESDGVGTADMRPEDLGSIDMEPGDVGPIELDPDDVETVDMEADDVPATETLPVPAAVDSVAHSEPAWTLEAAPDAAPHDDDMAAVAEPASAPEAPSDGFSGDAVDTKLDLARAYIDLDDSEGAKAMLREALDEGSQMQRDVAQKLLDGLA